MRIPIREQLGLLVLTCCLFALMVLSVATWTQNYGFVMDIRLSALSLAASVKSAHVSASLLLYRTAVRSIATRLNIQFALGRYNDGNDTEANWAQTRVVLQGAMSGGITNAVLQAIIFPKNDTGTGNVHGLVNVTSEDHSEPIKLPTFHPNGTHVYLGDPGLGYPPQLYPNFTYSNPPVDGTENRTRAYFHGQELQLEDTLILGPHTVNDTFFLLSMTTAVRRNTFRDDVLGWITVVIDASLISDAIASREGLQDTGQILIVAPRAANNLFGPDVDLDDPASTKKQLVRFAFAPESTPELGDRHDARALRTGDPSLEFPMRDYPAAVDAWTRKNTAVNNAGAIISTRNEEGRKVSVGYATLSSHLVDWILLFEESHAEVVAPIRHLRKIVLACVFGTTGLIMILLFPIAHIAVRPIRQLRAATSNTVQPLPPSDGSNQSLNSSEQRESSASDEERLGTSGEKKGFSGLVSRWRHGAGDPSRAGIRHDSGHTSFKIPGKVPEAHPWIQDELFDLTSTFNEMSDELVLHYDRLEERVKERTAQLEESKKAAEAANASKTLFIANISHELKTPLNGILGMCAVCMQEEDMQKVRRSLGIIYKSGDLLLHLLTDLLTFSKNSIGQRLTLDESEFRLLDVSTQVSSIFEKQAREGGIDLQVEFLGTCDALGNTSDDSGPKLYGPAGTGRVRDMCLWGDKNRILQVLINLVSNSLKFTPRAGSVHVRIRCTGLRDDLAPKRMDSTTTESVHSKQSWKARSLWLKRSRGSDSSINATVTAAAATESNTKLQRVDSKRGKEVNVVVAGEAKQLPQVAVRGRSVSLAPLNTKSLAFEFAVTDTGPGIPEEQMSKIFQPFVQGDLGLSKKFAGTGLGLSICAQLASLMGGSITLQSTEGVGSTFGVKLPLRHVQERLTSNSSSPVRMASQPTSTTGHSLHDDPLPENVGLTPDNDSVVERDSPPLQNVPRIVGFSQPYFPPDVVRDDAASPNRSSEIKKAEDEAAKKGEKVRVLVAEDNKVNQEVVTRMLKLESVYNVTIAKDGQEALDMVRDSMDSGRRFDLVFMDVQMPRLDGIQSTKLIRKIGFSAPIVALTAFAEESNIKDCYDSGMDFFLPKPIRRRELKSVLKKYCPPTILEHDQEQEHGTATKSHGRVDDIGKEASTSATAAAGSKIPAEHSATNAPATKVTDGATATSPVPTSPSRSTPIPTIAQSSADANNSNNTNNKLDSTRPPEDKAVAPAAVPCELLPDHDSPTTALSTDETPTGKGDEVEKSGGTHD